MSRMGKRDTFRMLRSRYERVSIDKCLILYIQFNTFANLFQVPRYRPVLVLFVVVFAISYGIEYYMKWREQRMRNTIQIANNARHIDEQREQNVADGHQ